MSPVSVRNFDTRDFTELVAQWHETSIQSYWYCAEQQRHSLHDAQRYFAEVVLTSCSVYVAEYEGTSAGVLALDAPWIRQLTVFPMFQRRRVGRALLQKARHMSATELRLFTFQRNAAARAFYESAGFEAVAFGISPAPESKPDVAYRWLASLRNAT